MTERAPKLRVNLQVASPSAPRGGTDAPRKPAVGSPPEAPDFMYDSAQEQAKVPNEQIRALFSDYEGKVAAKETTSIEEDAQDEKRIGRRLRSPAPLDEDSMLASTTDNGQPIFALAAGLRRKDSDEGGGMFRLGLSDVPTPPAPTGGIMYSSYGKNKPIMESAPNKRISWRCGLCGYHVLAMDRDGNPLPLTLSAFGEPLPMCCPRCGVEHTSWSQAVPFNQYGDHVNVRSRLSNHYQTAAITSTGTLSSEARATTPPPLQAAALTTLGKGSNPQPPSSGAGGAALAFKRPQGGKRAPTRMAYYCGLCRRRLLRADARGELIPLDTNDKGEVLPVLCPGCGETHSNWKIKPFSSNTH